MELHLTSVMHIPGEEGGSERRGTRAAARVESKGSWLLDQVSASVVYRGTSLMRKRNPLGPYCRPMPRVPGGS